MPAKPLLLAVAAVSMLAGLLPDRAQGDPPPEFQPSPIPRFHVPRGFVVERVAAPPLVCYPLFAAFDDRGRLYVAEGTGTNLPGEELVKLHRGRILRLVDTDGDGVFDVSTVFAADLVFPTGVLWHDGAVYAASHPSLWRFEDNDEDGQSDRREALVGQFRFNGNGCDVHGPFLGPDGWLYWTDGRHGYQVATREGPVLEGFAARIWRGRPDGRGIERICGGGFDNPVELAFTPDGALIGTMDQGPGDALLHYVEGGVYPMDHPCVKEFVMTGPMLGAIRQYSAALPVALCGLTAYRSAQFGPEYHGTFFTAQFNVHRIENHTLVRDGSTFRSVERDFVTSDSYDVHLSDVLEDADGSLLFVDMGAWFNYGCPTSKIAKPEVPGAIYRVRRTGAPAVTDPWGKSLKLESVEPAALAERLDDPRPKVQERVIAQLSKRGPTAVAALGDIVRHSTARPGAAAPKPRSVEARRNAVWALGRIAAPAARDVVRHALTDPDAGVRHAAAHLAGLVRDPQAVEPLMTMLARDEPPLRLKAAAGLGRLGQPRAIPALRAALRDATGDRFLEHALIYALIQIDHRDATLALLDDPHPRVRQAGLIALDQMPSGRLTREQVVPLLDTDDPDLQQTALRVMERHPDWSRAVLGLVKMWLDQPKLTNEQRRSLEGALLGFCGDPSVQDMVGDAMEQARTPPPTRWLLLRALARCRLDPLPEPWIAALGKALDHPDLPVRREAVVTIKMRRLDRYDDALAAFARRADLPDDLRIAAMEGVAAAGKPRPLDEAALTFLIERLTPATEPLIRAAAARAVSVHALDDAQLIRLAGPLGQADPIVTPLLVTAFTRNPDPNPEVARSLLAALKRTPGTASLSTADLATWVAHAPPEVRALARPLLESLASRRSQQASYLGALTAELARTPGDPERGKVVFFARKVGCYGCHRAAGSGAQLGPDLSQIGRFRTPRDLLESIVFPSSSIVPQFRSFVIATRDGRVTQGMIAHEDDEAIDLRTAELDELRIARRHIEAIRLSDTSIMPEGLEKTMTPQDLGDLIEFLSRQK